MGTSNGGPRRMQQAPELAKIKGHDTLPAMSSSDLDSFMSVFSVMLYAAGIGSMVAIVQTSSFTKKTAEHTSRIEAELSQLRRDLREAINGKASKSVSNADGKTSESHE